ncbi:MAG: hypothetical protein M1829_004071 [Trizodia sp. TS-e1964]|nr:MAG: hypothetical protein M1829_004071 [Trizodia sp. TS-e1964]
MPRPDGLPAASEPPTRRSMDRFGPGSPGSAAHSKNTAPADRLQLLLGLENIIDGPGALIQDPDVAPTKGRPVGSQKRLPKSSTLRNPSGFEGIVEPPESKYRVKIHGQRE